MLFLLFHTSKDLFAIDASSVVEVIPRVSLTKIQHVPDYVAGLFNYRSAIVPVIDLCHLIQNAPSRSLLSTRIILVQHPYQQHNPALKYLGLMAERVTETLNIDVSEIRSSSVRAEEAPYLNGTIVHEHRIIQCVQLERLFSDRQHAHLLMGEQTEPILSETTIAEVH